MHRITEVSIKIEDREYTLIGEKEIWKYILNAIRTMKKKEESSYTIVGITTEGECYICKGTGTIGLNVCQNCNGYGEDIVEINDHNIAWRIISKHLQTRKIGIEKKLT